jgi:hypothetical protein
VNGIVLPVLVRYGRLHPGSCGGQRFLLETGPSWLMMVVEARGILMMMQTEHESRSGDSRRARPGIEFPAPGCGHRVQIGRRQR